MKALRNDRTLARIVGPGWETPEWEALGKCLDVIGTSWDSGVGYGYVKANWVRLDRDLASIERSCAQARKLLRPNAQGHTLARSEAEGQ